MALRAAAAPVKGIEFVRPEVVMLNPTWSMISDAIQGEGAIKGEYGVNAEFYEVPLDYSRSQARKYLPQPNPLDKTPENMARYEQYVRRANYYNFCRRTRDGLVGQVFLRPPVEKKPKELSSLDQNADGKGLGLVQVAKRAVQSTLSFGRGGLLTDYPPTTGPSTPQQIKDNNLQTTISHYQPWQITNWQTTTVGAKTVLSLVVLKEKQINPVDDYSYQEVFVYRSLHLISGSYVVRKHVPKKNSNVVSRNNKLQYDVTETKPTKQDGSAWTEIPFQFVGSEANDIIPDNPPMYDLCSLNIGHYRNSADYEESCFMVGQPTPVISGVTKYWVDEVIKGDIRFGSRDPLSLPEGATATLLQAAPNSQPLEAMKHKEEQAVSLGAKLVQPTGKVRTATEAVIDTTSENSTLHTIAKNVSAAIEQCLKWACAFVGVDPVDVTVSNPDSASDPNAVQYQLNTEFELTRMNANDRLAAIKVWQSGAIAFPELRNVLKVDGIATMDDKEALDAIRAEQAYAAVLGGALIADPLQSTDPNAPVNTPPPGPNQSVQSILPKGISSRPNKVATMKAPAKKTAAKKTAVKRAA